MIIALASLGLPLLVGFAAETLAFYGAFTSKIFATPISIQTLTIIAATGIILTAGYLLWMLQKVFFGTMFTKWKTLNDLTPHEVVVLLSLTLAIVFFGLYPSGLTGYFVPTITSFINLIGV
jgi:NADH-quinone oxidoreductase subunit M